MCVCADIEHLTVRLDLHASSTAAAGKALSSTPLNSGLVYQATLAGVWYNSHRNHEGEWRTAADAPRTACGRLAAYVAKDGHGVYPQVGACVLLLVCVCASCLALGM